MSHFISQVTQNRRQHIKKFQSRVLNRSCADLLFYDKLADYMLQCCSAQAKPNTISVFSLLPLILCNVVIVPGQGWSYVVAIITFLMHQVFDIANKKQAYRLSQFNMITYYLDHLYDSMSCILIVNITGQLFELQNETRLTCIFFFAMLPFYTHHLAMYANGYLTFYNISPAVQGLLMLQLLFLVCAFFPTIPNLFILHFKFYHIFIAFCTIWLIIFLIDDIRTIANIKKDVHHSNLPSQTMPVKNLFVVGVLGYIMIEMTIVEEHLLNDSLYFTFCVSGLTLIYTFIISQLILSYGFEEKHRQFTLNTLLGLFWMVLYYSICGLVDLPAQMELVMGKVWFGIFFVTQLVYFFYYHYNNVKYLNSIIKDQ